MSFYKIFGTDKNAETEGVWIDYGEAGRIKIARSGGANKAYTNALQKMYKENRRQMETDTMSDEVAERKVREIFVRHVIIDWEGVKDANGKNMSCTFDNANKLLTDLPDLYRDLIQEAGKVSNFRAEALEADAKNS